MNSISKLLLYWYLFLTVLAIVSPITIPFVDLIGGLALLWITYSFFLIGGYSKLWSSSAIKSIPDRVYLKPWPLHIVAVGAVGASLLAVKFYTGKTVPEVILSLILKASLYNDYQKYFADQNIAVFSMAKIPAILAMLYLKLSVIYTFVSVFILNKKLAPKNFFWLFVVVISQLFFSIARGTSYELFELLLLLWFCLYIRKAVFKTKVSIFSRQNTIFTVFIILTASLYSYNISARYSFGDLSSCSTLDLCLDKESIAYHISAPLSEFLYKISGYFTFGIFYTSKFISEFWLGNLKNMVSLFWPFADIYRPELKSDFLCDGIVDCGASWIPDIITYVLRCGYFNVLLFVFILGHVTKRLLSIIFIQPRFIEVAVLFFIFLGVVSLPVGNFITVSSSNTLGFILLISLFFCRKIYFLYINKVRQAKFQEYQGSD